MSSKLPQGFSVTYDVDTQEIELNSARFFGYKADRQTPWRFERAPSEDIDPNQTERFFAWLWHGADDYGLLDWDGVSRPISNGILQDACKVLCTIEQAFDEFLRNMGR